MIERLVLFCAKKTIPHACFSFPYPSDFLFYFPGGHDWLISQKQQVESRLIPILHHHRIISLPEFVLSPFTCYNLYFHLLFIICSYSNGFRFRPSKQRAGWYTYVEGRTHYLASMNTAASKALMLKDIFQSYKEHFVLELQKNNKNNFPKYFTITSSSFQPFNFER